MFSTIKLYIIGIGAALMGVLYAIIRYQSSKIYELEHESKINDKLKEIRKDQQEFKEEVLIDEKKAINEKLKVKSDDSLRDELNGL